MDKPYDWLENRTRHFGYKPVDEIVEDVMFLGGGKIVLRSWFVTRKTKEAGYPYQIEVAFEEGYRPRYKLRDALSWQDHGRMNDWTAVGHLRTDTLCFTNETDAVLARMLLDG